MNIWKKYRMFWKNDFIIYAALLLAMSIWFVFSGITFLRWLAVSGVLFLCWGMSLCASQVDYKRHAYLSNLPISYQRLHRAVLWQMDWVLLLVLLDSMVCLGIGIAVRGAQVWSLLPALCLLLSMIGLYLTVIYLFHILRPGSFGRADADTMAMYGAVAFILFLSSLFFGTRFMNLYLPIQAVSVIVLGTVIFLMRRYYAGKGGCI